MPQNIQETVTFKIEPTKRAELDHIAQAQDRDRSHIIREAIDHYIELQNWQADHIREGLRQAEAGNVVPHDKVKRWAQSLGSKKELPRPTAPKAKRRA
jgi:predicted transcriptional regulator